MDDRFCPGHMGHVELPVPVYNPLFFPQLYLFLRSTCVYCHQFKMKSTEVHRYACKLKLLQYGLTMEAQHIDSFQLGDEVDSKEDAFDAMEVDLAKKKSDSDKASDVQALRARRDEYVNRAIAKAISEGKSSQEGVQTASLGEERKALLHNFYLVVRNLRSCDNCKMISPKYRKDGFAKIFEQPLSVKDQRHNSLRSLKRKRVVIQDGEIKQKAPPSEETQIRLPAEVVNEGRQSSRYVLSVEVLNLIRSLFVQERDMCTLLFHKRPNTTEPVSADMFFIENLVVPPTRFRMPSQLGDQIHTNPQNDLLAAILTTAHRVRDLNLRMNEFKKEGIEGEERKNVFTHLMNALVTIQHDVNYYLDSSKAPSTAGSTPLPGIKQALEKKEGLFRKNMMGKRVNYAARSVISPDPNIETNEIGIPPVFAVGLTYPEPVTSFNFHEMRQAVINGPTVWPGAVSIKNEDGSMINLEGMSLEQRTALANQLLTPSTVNGVVNKKVFRHIRNHDVVLMNRQPTLHKASMMGHKVRVLPGEKTLRLHYANTGAYNADFDGDEMNMHFPQNENARAEALMIANTDSQYLTPTSGKPLRGLIQDHISAGVLLTSKDTFFTREKYQQLVYGCLRPEDGHTTSGRILTVPPAIMKPRPMWTGKQVITTALLNIKPLDRMGLNLKSKNKIKNEYWGVGSTENEVIFRNGELVCGILDKSQYGSADYGLVHSVHEIYGAHSAGSLLSVLGRLFTRYVTSIGLTCGMDDLHLTAEGDQWRRDILETAADVGRKAAAEVTNLDPSVSETDPEFRRRLEEILRDDDKLAILDAITQSKVNVVASSVVSKCIPDGTEKRFPVNAMQSMALSGAKGSNVNVSQIMCLLGQQALEGRRVPVMVSGKTLPSFKPFDTQARAGGYISGRFFSGIKPQEYYFHCFATDHQVLTDRGFLFGKEIEALVTNGEALTFASYDPEAEAFSYQPATHFVRRPHDPRKESMVSVTYSAERGRWNGKSDEYGQYSDSTGDQGCESNRVSLLVTSDHDLFTQFIDGGSPLQANGKVIPPSKMKAGEFLKPSTPSESRFKMWGFAKNGLTGAATADANANATAMFDRLGLITETQQLAFLRFYGYWLENGTMVGGNTPAIICHPRKQHDWVYLRELMAALSLEEDVDYREYEHDRMMLQIVKPSWVEAFFSEYGTCDMSLNSAKWFWPWAMRLGKVQLRAVIEGLRYADGSVSPCAAIQVKNEDEDLKDVKEQLSDFEDEAIDVSDKVTVSEQTRSSGDCIYTSSTLFRDQLIVALMHAGFSAYFTLQQHAGVNASGKSSESWAVCYTDIPRVAAPTMKRDDVEEETTYQGDVWCVTVPPHGLIVTRRARINEKKVVTYASRPLVVGNCMAGREGLIDTAVKTSRSGYLQRCLIKQLEGVQVTYDNSVRDSDGTLIQFMYGGDAVDVIKESHLTKFQFCAENFESLLQKHQPGEKAVNLDIEAAISYSKKVKKHNKKHADEPHYIQSAKYDPVVSTYNPGKYIGSVSEVFDQQLEDFISKNPQLFISKKDAKAGLPGVQEKTFRALMQLKYMQSIVDPGEAVGIIASESIGEPSTQMTLNTFHFAGHGAANVTLGIPRMREIIMTASANIKTPQMTLPILSDITDEQADIFCKSVAKIVLSEIVDKVTVTENVGQGVDGIATRSYTIRVKFYTREEYESEYDISQSQLEHCMTGNFIDLLTSTIKKEIKKNNTATEVIGKATPIRDENRVSRAREDYSDGEDGDADDDKIRSATKQSVSYDAPDDDELDVMEKAQRTSDEEDSDSDESGEESDSDSDSDDDNTSSNGARSSDAKAREEAIFTKHKNCSKFDFDDVDGEYCEFRLEYPSSIKKILMVNLIEDLCRKVVVRQIPSIGRCLHPPPEQHDGNRVLVTEGVNFHAMWEEDAFIDVNTITANDVVSVLRTYGVEAARNTIVREINNVFKTYAISVNTRHLDLIADMMTREGTYLPFNRQGVDSGTSPFMKMSFETTCQFLTKAVMDADTDTLDNPSARIVVGKTSKTGTGSFDVFTPISGL